MPTTALALPKILKVNACGRLLEITSEGASSLTHLRRELVAKLRVCNPASLQLTDVNGKVLQGDADLLLTMQEGHLPLQAKLTVAALHEIEQKKKETRTKEHDMVGLQWQIVIEQVAAFSHELAAMGAHVQSVHDDSRKIVQQFEVEEKNRREQVMDAMKNEAMEREASHRDLLAKIDEVTQFVMEERSTREVNYYQLGKQLEQTTLEFNAAQTSRTQEHSDTERRLTSMRNDLDLAVQRNNENWNRSLETLKHLDQRDKDHTAAGLTQHQRLVALDADMRKLRADVDNLDLVVTKQMRDTHLHLSRYGEELERNTREGQESRERDIAFVAKDAETCWQNLATQLRQAREETARVQREMEERSKVLELRCQSLEKEHADRWDAQASKDHCFLDKVNKSEANAGSFQLERYSNEAVLRTTVAKVEDLVERVKATEGNLSSKVHSDHLKAQVENFAEMIQKQEARVLRMEREFNMRISQESAHRDIAMTHLQGTVKNCFDRVARDTEEAVGTRELLRSVSPQVARRRLTSSQLVLTNGSSHSHPVTSVSPMGTLATVANADMKPTSPELFVPGVIQPMPMALQTVSRAPTNSTGWAARSVSPYSTSRAARP
mmetsp:Transcript_29132/g.79967  ORF Transcript_29132/g.79967 Transcript_29132/m.79967 type:complete len:609 (+) Transcript_29132:73-1899(+)